MNSQYFSRLFTKLPFLFVAAFLLCAIYLAAFAGKFHHWNPTGFSYINKAYPAPGIWDEKTIVNEEDKYDGMFYYYMAYDPLILKDAAWYENTFDMPAYRYERVMYPLTVFLCSFGSHALMPWMMLAVNCAAFAGVALFLALMARETGKNELTAFWFLLLPGVAIVLTHNLTEGMQLLGLAGGIWYWSFKRNLSLAVLFFTVAVLSKSLSVLIPFGLFVADILEKRGIRGIGPSFVVFCVPVGLLVLWKGYVTLRLGPMNLEDVGASVSLVPVVGLIGQIGDLAGIKETGRMLKEFYGLGICVFAVVIGLFLSLQRGILRLRIGVPLVVVALFFLFLTRGGGWGDFFGFGRTITPLFLLLFIYYLETGKKVALLPIVVASTYTVVWTFGKLLS